MSHRPDPDDEEDRPSVLEHLQQMRASAESAFGRSLDDECDECGEVEGSVTTNSEQGWTLCRTCMNDPEILAQHADG